MRHTTDAQATKLEVGIRRSKRKSGRAAPEGHPIKAQPSNPRRASDQSAPPQSRSPRKAFDQSASCADQSAAPEAQPQLRLGLGFRPRRAAQLRQCFAWIVASRCNSSSSMSLVSVAIISYKELQRSIPRKIVKNTAEQKPSRCLVKALLPGSVASEESMSWKSSRVLLSYLTHIRGFSKAHPFCDRAPLISAKDTHGAY